MTMNVRFHGTFSLSSPSVPCIFVGEYLEEGLLRSFAPSLLSRIFLEINIKKAKFMLSIERLHQSVFHNHKTKSKVLKEIIKRFDIFLDANSIYDFQKLVQTTVRFRFDGQPISENDTPQGLEMEDGDTIEVYQQQTGGSCHHHHLQPL